MIAQYFVEFIVFSFAGWIFESIYCTIKEKGWRNRGFLFGPVCPIYGSGVLTADIVFSNVFNLQTALAMPVWKVFLICMGGSAVIEYVTSWYLEKRFHAKWWDYSDLPLNLNGRISILTSTGFGLAGIVVVRYVVPLIEVAQRSTNIYLVEIVSLIFAGLIGADLALTEASLSTLLRDIEQYKLEFDENAQEAYLTVSSVPEKVSTSITTAKENVKTAKESVKSATETAVETAMETAANRKDRMKDLADRYISRMSPMQLAHMKKIKFFRPIHSMNPKERLHSLEVLKNEIERRFREGNTPETK